MNKLIKLNQWFVSGSKKLTPVIATLLALVCTAPASAHSPGMDEIIQITTQLAETGEQAALYAKRARIFQNHNMWQEAMADFDKAARLDSQDPTYDLDRAGLSCVAGEYLRSLDFINLYLLRHDKSTEAALIQARSFRALGNINHRSIPMRRPSRIYRVSMATPCRNSTSNLPKPICWLTINKTP